MEIKKANLRDGGGSCNFCDRGKLSEFGNNLDFPYDHVYVVQGRSVEVRICEDCITQMKKIYNA